jgi:hypothetical protein
MKQSMNYITALPDFIGMQRVSFCWFIAQGLNEELAMFSRIHDFSYNTEYILFGHEYRLVKPIYNTTRAKKYTSNYAAQLVIPLEVRNKKLNSIRYHSQFPIINLPLMTTSATFIINGCERVIVSQIIRSPGIYFEKNKNQKKRKVIKRKLSSDINKLKTFIPLGEPFISEQILSFFPIIHNQSLFQYSFNKLKKTQIDFYLYFLESFKIYHIISKTIHSQKKIERIKIFLHWLKIKKDKFRKVNELDDFTPNYLINYWNSLLKSLVKYNLLNQSLTNNIGNIEKQWFSKNYPVSTIPNFSSNNNKAILNYYEKVIQFKFTDKLLLILLDNKKQFKQITQFRFLNKQFVSTNEDINLTIRNIKQKNLKPTFYFSTTLKELCKYKNKKKKYILKMLTLNKVHYKKVQSQISRRFLRRRLIRDFIF